MAEAFPFEIERSLTSLICVFGLVETTSQAYWKSLEIIRQCLGDSASETSKARSLDKASRHSLFRCLTLCLNETRLSGAEHHVGALCILADVSREKEWRGEFAACKTRSVQPGWPPDPDHPSCSYSSHEWQSKEAECVLHVAVRTLHPRSVGKDAQAAYHAIRLISNCCADDDVNKRVVLECGGMEMLLRCVHSRLWPDLITVALWNICADCDDSTDADGSELMGVSDDALKQKVALPIPMSSVATIQLCLRSRGECDDWGGDDRKRPSDVYWASNANIISDLLQLSSLITDRVRKEMVAELLEKASWKLFTPSSPADPKQYLSEAPEETRLGRYSVDPKHFLVDLLQGPGPALAMSYPDCNRDVIQSIAILISRADIQRELIDHDLVKAFFTVPNWEIAKAEPDLTVDSDTSMVNTKQSISKIIYEVAASPSFAARYGSSKESSELVLQCISTLRSFSTTGPKAHSIDHIPLAMAFLTIANLTGSEEDALFFVQKKEIHKYLSLILRQEFDPAVLFPALALLDRLAIARDNKRLLYATGVTGSFPRIFNDYDLQPALQREAVSAMRKIVEGIMNGVSDISTSEYMSKDSQSRPESSQELQEESCLVAALRLFHRTSDAEVKMEVSRLTVEVCRTVFHSTGGHPEQAEDTIRDILGEITAVSPPLVFMICEAPTKALQGEGWFALAILSTWPHGRLIVLDCLADGVVREKAQLALMENEEALSQNIGLMLTKLQLLPSHSVDDATRDFVERTARTGGLPSIWSEMGAVA